ncbi:MAG TPA: hypothetical protein PLJ38_12215 [bacterium]|nr:hypothetical protein [bacterium]
MDKYCLIAIDCSGIAIFKESLSGKEQHKMAYAISLLCAGSKV